MKSFETQWNVATGGFNFGNRKQELIEFAKKNPRMRYKLVPMLPESKKQRKFYHGAFLPLWAYLDGKNYKSWEIIQDYHEIAKLEFSGEVKMANGKSYLVGGSSKNNLDDILEKGIEMLQEQYGIDPLKCLNPKHFKDFRDRVYPSGDYDSYISYLVALKLL